MPQPKVVARIAGGLGNQLFAYAAARRLSLVSGAELVIDDETGFVRDRTYRRQYALDAFGIGARKASRAEKLRPFERVRRGALRARSRRLPFSERTYVSQEGLDFDPRLLDLRPRRMVFLEGYWISEGYFSDVADTIRGDLQLAAPLSGDDRKVEAAMRAANAVAIHVRWFDKPGASGHQNAGADYYRRAVALMDSRVATPHYFLFSDDPQAARDHLALPPERTTIVDHNRSAATAYADLWLMSRCRHFIMANSTFSWWGAWLGSDAQKIVVAPSAQTVPIPSWTFRGLIPAAWTTL